MTRFFDAINSAAVGGFVEVGVENLVFGVYTSESKGEDYFFYFARDSFVLREKRILDDLLCNRRAALSAQEIAARQVSPHGAHESERAEAGIFVEGSVFDGYRRFLDVGRNLFERNRRASHRAVHIVEDDISRAVEYLGGLRDLAILKIIYRGYRHDGRPNNPAADDEQDRNSSDKDARFEPCRHAAPDVFDAAKKTSS